MTVPFPFHIAPVTCLLLLWDLMLDYDHSFPVHIAPVTCLLLWDLMLDCDRFFPLLVCCFRGAFSTSVLCLSSLVLNYLPAPQLVSGIGTVAEPVLPVLLCQLSVPARTSSSLIPTKTSSIAKGKYICLAYDNRIA